MRKVFALLIVIFFLASGITWAQDERFEATLEKSRVSVGNPIYLYLTFYGSQNVDRPEVSPMDGLRIKYVGPATKMSVINGKVSQSVAHVYLIIPLKGGDYEIGPFFVDYHGEMYKADVVPLVVSDLPTQPARPGPSAIPSPPTRDTSEWVPYASDRIFLTMEVDKTLVYINEPVLVTIKIYVNGLGLKDIEYPTYLNEGFSTGELVEPERRREIVRGVKYDVLVFRQHIFAIKEGDYVLGPARLRCKMIVRKAPTRRSSLFGASVFDDDFFSSRFGHKAYPIELESKETPVSILPFPKENRPSDFQGAVGYFDLDASVHPIKVKIGDPTVLRMVISGRGNLDTVTAPRLASTGNFKTYEPQVTKKGGKKIYEQVLIPKTDNLKEIPEVSFSFFNPSSKKYKTIRRGPFPVEVVKQPESERTVKMVSMPGVEHMFYPEEEVGKDIIHIKENIGRLQRRDRFLYKRWLFWIGQLIPFVLFVAFYTSYRKRERMRSDKSYARFLKAPRKARKGLAKAKAYLGRKDALPFYDIMFKTLQEYLGDRFNLPKGNITAQAIEERLHPIAYDKNILEMLHEVFSRCEMARYASSVPGGDEAKEMLEEVKRIIDYMEKVRL